MIKRCLYVGIIILIVLYLVAAKEKCEKCLLVDECSFYGNLNAEEQERWIERFECPKTEKEHTRHLFGFASRAKGDVICCPDNIWGINNQNGGIRTETNFNHNPKHNSQSNFNPHIESKSSFNTQNSDNNRPINDYSSPHQSNDFDQDFNSYNHDSNLEPQRWNSRSHPQNINRGLGRMQNQGFDRNRNSDFNGNFYQSENRNNQGFNQNQGYKNENPYFNSRNGNARATNQGKQCSLSNFPPNSETGCCGLEATDANRVTGSQSPPAKRFPVPSRPNWMPHNSPYTQAVQPGWNSPWKPTDDLQNYMPRFKRETDVNVTVGNRIAGGKETELEQYPWTVLLKTTFDYGTRKSAFNCGGSIISSRYILTAAHCVVEENARVADVEVHLAEYDKRTFPRDCKNVLGEGQKCVENIIMHAEDVIPHPQYDDNRLYNDIALIRLSGTAPYTDYIRPICLPPINIDNPDLFNLRLAVAGWGRNGRYKSDIKQSTIVNLVPNSECKEFYPSLSKAHLCAAGYSGEDTCKGDSGGPLMILYEGKYYVSGVVSGKRADAPCGTSVPSLYTNVYQYLGWIRSKIKN